MRCPYCTHPDSQVKDSRPSEDGLAIRRRRYCPTCNSRFTTFERVQLREITALKRNGERKLFDREKIQKSIQIACRKRPVSDAQIDQIVTRVVQTIEASGENEIQTTQIGTLIMDELKALDSVAYIRYASVYRDFREARDFEHIVQALGEGFEQHGE